MMNSMNYDRQVIKAAEVWFDLQARKLFPEGSSDALLYDAIQNRREFQRRLDHKQVWLWIGPFIFVWRK